MSTLTYSQLEGQFLTQKRSTILGLTLIAPLTVDNMRVTGNPFKDNVFKVSEMHGMTGISYSNSVNKQRSREDKPGDFVAEPPAFGTVIQGTPLMKHTPKKRNPQKREFLYLRMSLQGSPNARYFHIDSGVEFQGEELDDLRGYLKTVDRKAEAKRQDVERPIVWRCVRLDHVAELRKNKQVLHIRGHLATLRRLGILKPAKKTSPGDVTNSPA